MGPIETRVRPGSQGDAARLNEIYNHYVAAGAVTFDTRPTGLEQRRRWIGDFAETGPHRLLVVEVGGSVGGWVASVPFRAKPAYATSVETSVYLSPEHTGRGLGGTLYAALFASLRGEDLHRAYAGITLPNPASVGLHEKLGFERIGVFREVGRKQGRYWDVAWYEKPLGDGPLRPSASPAGRL